MSADNDVVIIKLGLWKEGETPIFRPVMYNLQNSSCEGMLQNLKNYAVGQFLEEELSGVEQILEHIEDYTVALFYEDLEGDNVWLYTDEDLYHAVREYQKRKRVKVWANVRPAHSAAKTKKTSQPSPSISTHEAKSVSSATTQTSAPDKASSNTKSTPATTEATTNSSKELVDAVTDLISCVAVSVNAGLTTASGAAKQAQKISKDAAKQAKRASKEAVKQVKKATKLEAAKVQAKTVVEPEPTAVQPTVEVANVPETKPEGTNGTSPSPAPSTASKLFVHGRHTCDQCLTTPIVGKRFHAVNLPDYDLCEKCFRNYDGKDITFVEAKLDRDVAFQDRWNRKHARFMKMKTGCAHATSHRPWGSSVPPHHFGPPPPFGPHPHHHHGPPFPPPPFGPHHHRGPPFPPPPFGPHHGPHKPFPPPHHYHCPPFQAQGNSEAMSANNIIDVQEDLALAEAIRRSLQESDATASAKVEIESNDDANETQVNLCVESSESEGDAKPTAVEEPDIVVEPAKSEDILQSSNDDDEDTFSDCKEAQEELLDAATKETFEVAVDKNEESDLPNVKLPPKSEESDSEESFETDLEVTNSPQVNLSPNKERNDSFTDDASGDIATFVGETLDRMADAINNLNEDGGAKIVDGEEEDDQSDSSSGSDWSVVDEDQRIARSMEALGSALFNSDLRSSEGEQVSAVSGLSHGSLSTATSVPTTIRSLPIGTEVSPVQLERWVVQLNQLHELGFLNDAFSVDVLETLAAANIGVDSDEEVTVQQVIDAMMKDW